MKIEDQIEKLKYQMQMVALAGDFSRIPIVPIFIELDWSEENVDTFYNVFAKYEDRVDCLETDEDYLLWYNHLNAELASFGGVDWEMLKRIIVAFDEGLQWTRVVSAWRSVYTRYN